jgi:hypothetical protein
MEPLECLMMFELVLQLLVPLLGITQQEPDFIRVANQLLDHQYETAMLYSMLLPS